MLRQWLDYLPALENAITVIATQIENLQFRDDWSPTQKIEGLQALQQIRNHWKVGKTTPDAMQVLQKISSHQALKANITFRASLESIRTWGTELQEQGSSEESK